MSAPTVTDPKYWFGIKGDPSTDSAQAKALAAAGPLLFAKDHILAVAMPDAFDTVSNAPKYTSDQVDMHSLIIPGAIFDQSVLSNGMHMAVGCNRLAAFMQAADNAGLDLTPIPGPPEVAFPKFEKRFIPVIKALPDERRILTDDEVFYDDDPQSEEREAALDEIDSYNTTPIGCGPA